MFEFLDSELLVYLLPISIIAILIIFFIFTKIFKLSSKLKLFFMSVVAYILIAVLGITILYVSNNEFEYINEAKYAISGKIQEVHSDYIVIYVTSSNLDGISGRVKIKINDTTAIFSQKESSNLVKITSKDLGVADITDVTCIYNEETKIITAIKIVVK